MRVASLFIKSVATSVVALLSFTATHAQEEPVDLREVTLALQDTIPYLGYQFGVGKSSRGDCIEVLVQGLWYIRTGRETSLFNDLLHQSGCLDQYSWLFQEGEPWPTTPDRYPFLMQLIEDTLYLKFYHFYFEDGLGSIYMRLHSLGLGLGDGMRPLTTIERIVLDLRGNPGGSGDAGAALLSFFPSTDEPIQIEMTFRTDELRVEWRSPEQQFSPTAELIILVDHRTVSMAEVVAGALAGVYPNALIVGEQTYGKGFIQWRLEYGPFVLILTTGEVLLPNGERIQGNGIMPNVTNHRIATCVTVACILNLLETAPPQREVVATVR